MPLSVDKLLSEFMSHRSLRERPWGFMRALNAPEADLTVKYLFVANGERTSLQKHERKDELLFIINGSGFVEVGEEQYGGAGLPVRIRPGVVHRVTGPLVYLEISSYDDGTDTIRLEDDYGR